MVKRKRSDLDICVQEECEISPRTKYAVPEGYQNAPQSPMLPASLQNIESELRKVMDDFVKVYERLDTTDNDICKPNYSYTELVYLAILRSPNFCLPITEIYKYMKSRFSFFRDSTRTHWKNAVRHSLSKTKCFTKINVGRGSRVSSGTNRSMFLWCILPTSIVSFARGDYRSTVDKESGTNTLRWGYYRVNAGHFWSQVAVYLQRKFETFQMTVAMSHNSRAIIECQKCDIPVEVEVTEANLQDDLENLILRPLSPTLTGNDMQLLLNNPDTSADSGHSTEEENSPISNLKSLSENDSGHETPGSSPAEEPLKSSSTYRGQNLMLNSSYLSYAQSTYLDENQRSPSLPDLPDLGHVSPFELSPLSLSRLGNTSPPDLSMSLSPLSNVNMYHPTPTKLSPASVSSSTYFNFPPVPCHSQIKQEFPRQSSPMTSFPVYTGTKRELSSASLTEATGSYPTYHQDYYSHFTHYPPTNYYGYSSRDMPTSYPAWNAYPIQGQDLMLPALPEWN